jgi:hypothetical protein
MSKATTRNRRVPPEPALDIEDAHEAILIAWAFVTAAHHFAHDDGGGDRSLILLDAGAAATALALIIVEQLSTHATKGET